MSEKKKILVVDDDPLIARMYEKKMENDGYEVATAANGEEAMTMIRKSVPDLILLDVMMPRMNGVETLHALHGDPKTAQIPVIMLSNLDDRPEDVEKAEELGAREYLVKAQTDLKTLSEHVLAALSIPK